MNKETYEALRRIMDTRKLIELLNEEKGLPENERYFSKDYWQVYGWIHEVEKEYEEENEVSILPKMCEKCESEKLKWVEKEGCKDELYVCESCGFEQPNCHSEAKEIKTDKDDFVSKIINEDKDDNKYKLDDIHEFADMYLQNLNTMEQNIKDFKEWVKNKN